MEEPLGFLAKSSLTLVESEVESSVDGWERLYRDEGPRLWRALFAYSRDRDIANDALDEAFTQAIARDRRIREPSSWIWTTAFKVASGELKRRRRTSAFKDPGHAYEMPETDPKLLAALQELTPKQRAAVILHDYADRPNDEIARVLGMRVQTVHVHLSQGRKRLRELLGGDG